MALHSYSHFHFVPQYSYSLNRNQPKHSPQQALRNGSRLTQYLQCIASTKTYQPTANRRPANYQPSIWSKDFLQSLKNNYADETYKERAMKLEKEVRRMIYGEDVAQLQMLELIDDIQRLGLGYRFEKDIRRAMDKVVSLEGCNGRREKSLHVTALGFRLLRQHGYEVSQGI